MWCTRQVGFCAIFGHFSGFEFFLLPSRVHGRPSASNANRWAVDGESRPGQIGLSDAGHTEYEKDHRYRFAEGIRRPLM
jgi:hypothetical protein